MNYIKCIFFSFLLLAKEGSVAQQWYGNTYGSDYHVVYPATSDVDEGKVLSLKFEFDVNDEFQCGSSFCVGKVDLIDEHSHKQIGTVERECAPICKDCDETVCFTKYIEVCDNNECIKVPKQVCERIIGRETERCSYTFQTIYGDFQVKGNEISQYPRSCQNPVSSCTFLDCVISTCFDCTSTGVEGNMNPYSYVDSKGQINGLNVDVISFFSKQCTDSINNEIHHHKAQDNDMSNNQLYAVDIQITKRENHSTNPFLGNYNQQNSYSNGRYYRTPVQNSYYPYRHQHAYRPSYVSNGQNSRYDTWNQRQGGYYNRYGRN